MKLSKNLMFVTLSVGIVFSAFAPQSADAGEYRKVQHNSMFEPLSKRSKRFISKALAVAVDKDKMAPAIVVLRQPEAMSRKPMDIQRLKKQIDSLQRTVLGSLDRADFRLVHKYDYVPGLAGLISHRGLRRLAWHPDVLGIDYDHQGEGHLSESLPLIGADDWHAEGVTGEGAMVAVLDTGVGNHPDLDDDLVAELCILNSNTIEGGIPCPDGTGQQLFDPDAALDGNGHGTNVTGIITSAGTVAPLGIAPDAEIVAIKVLDDQAPSGTGQISDWIKGLEWVLTLHPAVDGIYDVRAVNMSLGVTGQGFLGNGDCDVPGTSGQLMFWAADILRQVGVITVASSGNDGFAAGISFPACVTSIVSVGASDNNDQIKFFTNSNANLDLVAPGDNITSTGITNTGILTQSGTSQASPHVAACAALRISDNPALTTDQLQTILTNTPVFIVDPKNGLSFPRLNCIPPVLM